MRRIATGLLSGLLLTAGTIAVSAPAEAASNSCRSTVLRQGSVGYCTRMGQTLLKGPFATVGSRSPFTPGLALDGDFGSKTYAATRKFQTVQRIQVDGVIGAQTWSQLCAMGSGGGSASTTAQERTYNAAFAATC